MRRSVIVVALLLAFLAAPVLADVLYLKDGRKFTGKVVSENSKEVKFKSVGGILTFKRSEVDHIEKGLTKKDEYDARRKKISGSDIQGLLALAQWCEENRLIAQQRKLYRELTKKVPNHPQVRRAMGQIFADGKWVKRPKGYEEPTVRSGERKEIKGASVVLPKGWKIEMTENRIKATGPAPYAFAPVLTVTFSKPVSPMTSFNLKVSWERPFKEVSAAGLKGRQSTLSMPGEDGVGLVKLRAVLSGPDRGMIVELVTLGFEAARSGAALGMVLDTLKIKAPPSDFTNAHYKYCLNLPKGEGWTHKLDKVNDLYIGHLGDAPLDWAEMWIIAGAKGEEADEVQQSADLQVELLKKQGDITKQEEITFAGEKANFVDGTFLDDGYPLRMRILWLTHGDQKFLIYLKQHEFGVKRTNAAWDILVKSFRFLD